MSLFSPPDPPDPYATAAAQTQMNKSAAQTQAEMNMVNQTTPYGSLSYKQIGTAADGTPRYAASQRLNPAEQRLFNSTVNTQGTIAGDAGQLAKNLGPSLTKAPDLSTDAMVKQLMGWQSDYMKPYFDQQTSNTESKLAAQGITQGSPAYANAKRQLEQNQTGSMEQAMAADEGQAYSQALSTYQAPISTLGTLLGEGSPANLNSSLGTTPSESIQPANVSGLVEQNYQQQNAQYANLMSGLFGLGTAGITGAFGGGWGKAKAAI